MKKGENRLKWVWVFSKKYWLLFLIAEVCILVSYTVSLLLPMNLAYLTDKVLYGHRYRLMGEIIRNYIILFAAAGVFNLIYAFVWQSLQNRYIVDVKNELFRKTVYAKASWLSQMNSGDIMARIDGDSEQFLHVIQRNLFHFVNSFLLCTGIIITVWRMNGWIAVLLIMAAVLPIVLTRLFGILMQRYTAKSRETVGGFTGRLFELLKGMREIRLLGAQWWAESQVTKPLRTLIQLGNKTRRVDFALNKSVYFINLTASLCIYGFSAYLISQRQLTIGSFLAIMEYVALLHKKLNWMLRIYLDWFARKVSIDRVNALLNMEEERDEGFCMTEGIREIKFDSVRFRYGETPVLENVSFSLKKGQSVAVVGGSGMGKTTIAGLLLGLYEAQGGEISFNGIPMKSLRLSDIRRRVGMLSQEVTLFEASVRDNLLLGNTTLPDEELMRVCDELGIGDAVRNLPDGLDSRISQDCVDLSGGQKQRLMMARLLLKPMDVLVMDEATSALDVHTEADVLDCIHRLNGDLAVLVISHRLEAVLRCERIVVLDEGRIVASGTHEELLGKCGIYGRMFGGMTA